MDQINQKMGSHTLKVFDHPIVNQCLKFVKIEFCYCVCHLASGLQGPENKPWEGSQDAAFHTR
jgi:hypothetical protein